MTRLRSCQGPSDTAQAINTMLPWLVGSQENSRLFEEEKPPRTLPLREIRIEIPRKKDENTQDTGYSVAGKFDTAMLKFRHPR